MDFASKYWIAFFPFLKTSERIRFRGLEIRSGKDLEGIPNEIKGYVETLSSMFYLRQNIRIENPSFLYQITEDEIEKPNNFLKELEVLQAILGYIYSSPHPTFGDPFLSKEHSDFYLFRPVEVSKSLVYPSRDVKIMIDTDEIDTNEKGETPGFEGRINGKTLFWVIENEKIYASIPKVWLNYSQDIKRDLSKALKSSKYFPIVDYLYNRKENDYLGRRVITALKWYNRSTEVDIDDEVALVNLAIAFEALIGLDKGSQVTLRFKTAIKTLLGDFPRLESWLTQFYNARSEIVHDGESQNLFFEAIDEPSHGNRKEELLYRPLISYGRQIFQACVAAILTGVQVSNEMKLSSQLKTNSERIKNILEEIGSSREGPEEKILGVSDEIREIEDYRFVSENNLKVDRLIAVSKIIVGEYIKCQHEDHSELVKKMQDLIDSKSEFESLAALKKIEEEFKNLPSANDPNYKVLSTVKSLIESVWHYLFRYYFQLRREKKENS